MGERGARQDRFEQLYDQASVQVLGYALRRTGNPEDAADVVSETFMIAWRRLDEVPQGDEARLWLYGVARRVLANQRRGLQRRERLDARLRDEVALVSTLAVPERPGPDSPVMTALARLDEADRELLTLLAWEGLDRDQLARTLGHSRATIRVRLHRARRRLASLLGDERPDQRPSPPRPTRLPTERGGSRRYGAWASASSERKEAL
jgi:RNA polymerase sigma-70 factor (ECF subfamily)